MPTPINILNTTPPTHTHSLIHPCTTRSPFTLALTPLFPFTHSATPLKSHSSRLFLLLAPYNSHNTTF
ncbi:hypothetical protein E2C01_084156 [Portunus trituberculatus]|uniref:Uncharacterized protein n=1 Tax=Portunus trituberculatus TaxID=210409 RepID=A0A5B7IXI4_PORTR|nr:hypothetical protein [Portunus trituberculatus]